MTGNKIEKAKKHNVGIRVGGNPSHPPPYIIKSRTCAWNFGNVHDFIV